MNRLNSLFAALLLICCCSTLAQAARVTATASDVQAKIDAAQAGDVIVMQDGDNNLGTNQLRMRSDITLTSAGFVLGVEVRDTIPMIVWKNRATLRFDRPLGTPSQTSSNAFAILFPDNTRNATIEALTIRSDNGVFWLGRNFSNLRIIKNDISFGYDGNYYNRLCMKAPGGGDGLFFVENFVHDSEKSDRNFEVFGVANFVHEYNVFYLINDVGHWMNVTSGSDSYNYGRRIHRMGAEMQQDRFPGPPQGTATNRFKVLGNVFYDWEKPYWDSMLKSIPSYTQGMLIDGNYLRGNAWGGVFGEADSKGNVRGSYMLEAPQGPGGVITNNVFGGERMVGGIVRPGNNATVGAGNQVYGSIAWYGDQPVGGEAGSSADNPRGSVATVSFNRDLSRMPAPPKQPRPGNDPLPPPPPPLSFTINARATSDSEVLFAWGTLPAGTKTLRFKATTTVGREVQTPRDVQVGAEFFATVGGYNQNWQYDFTAEARDASGNMLATSNTLIGVQVKKPIDPPPPPPPLLELITPGRIGTEQIDVIWPLTPERKIVPGSTPTTRKAA